MDGFTSTENTTDNSESEIDSQSVNAASDESASDEAILTQSDPEEEEEEESDEARRERRKIEDGEYDNESDKETDESQDSEEDDTVASKRQHYRVVGLPIVDANNNYLHEREVVSLILQQLHYSQVDRKTLSEYSNYLDDNILFPPLNPYISSPEFTCFTTIKSAAFNNVYQHGATFKYNEFTYSVFDSVYNINIRPHSYAEVINTCYACIYLQHFKYYSKDLIEHIIYDAEFTTNLSYSSNKIICKKWDDCEDYIRKTAAAGMGNFGNKLMRRSWIKFDKFQIIPIFLECINNSDFEIYPIKLITYYCSQIVDGETYADEEPSTSATSSISTHDNEKILKLFANIVLNINSRLTRPEFIAKNLGTNVIDYGAYPIFSEHISIGIVINTFNRCVDATIAGNVYAKCGDYPLALIKQFVYDSNYTKLLFNKKYELTEKWNNLRKKINRVDISKLNSEFLTFEINEEWKPKAGHSATDYTCAEHLLGYLKVFGPRRFSADSCHTYDQSGRSIDYIAQAIYAATDYGPKKPRLVNFNVIDYYNAGLFDTIPPGRGIIILMMRTGGIGHGLVLARYADDGLLYMIDPSDAGKNDDLDKKPTTDLPRYFRRYGENSIGNAKTFMLPRGQAVPSTIKSTAGFRKTRKHGKHNKSGKAKKSNKKLKKNKRKRTKRF
jgi:hypothetical protein